MLSICTVHIDITLFDQSSFFPPLTSNVFPIYTIVGSVILHPAPPGAPVGAPRSNQCAMMGYKHRVLYIAGMQVPRLGL